MTAYSARRVLAFCVFSFVPLMAQEKSEPSTGREAAVKVYLDCQTRCDEDYIRREIPFVNYMLERKEADVHILITAQRTGAGGREYTINLYGQGRFASRSDTVKAVTLADDTQDQRREKMTEALKLALVPYALKTPLAKYLSVSYSAPSAPEEVIDPWNNWVFDLRGDIWANGSSNSRSAYKNMSVSARRVTEMWKFRTSASRSINRNEFDLVDENQEVIETITSEVIQLGSRLTLVRSIGDHMAIGTRGQARSSSYSNLDMSIGLAPAIEYNFFPYSESSQRDFRFNYSIGFAYSDYTDTTVYDKTEEILIRHALSSNLNLVRPWGTVELEFEFRQYFHDLDKYSWTLQPALNLKLVKGLSFNLWGSFSQIRDQLHLPKGTLSAEDILLRSADRATTFQYFFSAGLSYNFGSRFNNVVNDRF